MNEHDSTTMTVVPSNQAGGNALFSLDPGLAIWTWVVFGLLFLVLRKYAWAPLMNSVNEREATITQAIENAKATKEELAKIAGKQKEILHEAQDQAHKIIDEGRRAAEKVAFEISQKARQESDNTLSLAKKQIEEEKHRAIEELRTETVDLVIKTSQKLIQSSLDESEQKKMVDRYLENL